jgi:hypothetical protein
MSAATQGVQAGVLPMEVAYEMLLFAARRFRVGRQLEDKLQKIGEQLGQDQGPSPEEMAQQAEMQLEQAKLELEKTKIEGNLAIEAQKLQLEQAKLEQSGEVEGAKLQQKHIEALINRDTARINAAGGNE